MPETDNQAPSTEVTTTEDTGSRNALGIAILIVAVFVGLIWFVPAVLGFFFQLFGLVVGLIVGIFAAIAWFFASIFWLIFGLMGILLIFLPLILAGALALIIAVGLAKMLRGTTD